MEKKLQVRHLRISFRTTAGKVQAVRDISFDLHKGETMAIVGESGSGKSVTSKAILGILAGNAIVEGGEILYDGQDLLKIGEDDFYRLRGDKIAMIFQDPLSSLNPIMRIGKQLTEAMLLKGKARQRSSKENFHGKLNMLEKFMTQAPGADAAAVKEKCDQFRKFELKHIELEQGYNTAAEAAREALEETNNILFLIEKNAFKDDCAAQLRQVKESLNTMLREIETLKIEQYEKSLEAERYELAALKMQIRPHFFLNSLKLIYAMAETGETNQIQTMILLLAKHLRAVLDYNRRSITLHEEAELCQNYIELTTIGQPDERACCSAEIERGLEDFLLPPLSLLSLVENSVKHAGRSDRALTVQITAKTLPIDNGRLVYIQVRDSGPGFAPDILQELNKGDSAPAGHWGLNNIRRQCALLYGPEFAMTFTNAAAGGAVVELYIPQTDTLPTADKEDSAHETVDCG